MKVFYSRDDRFDEIEKKIDEIRDALPNLLLFYDDGQGHRGGGFQGAGDAIIECIADSMEENTPIRKIIAAAVRYAKIDELAAEIRKINDDIP